MVDIGYRPDGSGGDGGRPGRRLPLPPGSGNRQPFRRKTLATALEDLFRLLFPLHGRAFPGFSYTEPIAPARVSALKKGEA